MENKLETKNDNKLVPQGLYPDVNIGTENITTEDVNTPILKIVQKTTEGAEDMKLGSYLRSDTNEQLEEVPVNLVYVTTEQGENYNKTGIEYYKVYYGFYSGTNEPFKLYVRGWGLVSHRDFQTEVLAIKNKYQLPMLALEITLRTEKQQGTIKDTGKPYTTYKPVFEITKDTGGVPFVETNKERVNFLIEATRRFSQMQSSSYQTDNDEKMNDADGITDEVKPEDIPF